MSRQVIFFLIFNLILVSYDVKSSAGEDEKMKIAREKMVQEIELDVRQTSAYIGQEQLNEEVMRVIGEVPRHEFVPQEEQRAAYANRPLQIGYGQTISQPYIVALMTDLLAVSKEAKVLEVGAGSGYQAAVLSHLVKEVHSIEIIPQLALECRKRLARLGYSNITIHQGDGYYGLESKGPFDAIIVTAAASYVPPPLVSQLKPGGRMVIPVGTPFAVQHLMLLKKNDQGEISMRQVLPVQFVPLTGKRD